MKTEFWIFEPADYSAEKINKYIEIYGWEYNEEFGLPFKKVDMPIILNEGDKVEFNNVGTFLVARKEYNVDDDKMIYSLQEEW